MDATGVKQYTLRGRRLTGVDVRHDPDVPGALQGIFRILAHAGAGAFRPRRSMLVSLIPGCQFN
jgi:hypothetical protein